MFIVFDIETTGLNRVEDDIIQFAYAAFDANKVCVRAEVLYFYYPGMSWSEEAYAVHQIPLSELEKHADEFEANVIKMAAILNTANVVGHNAESFDCPFVTNWLYKIGITRFGFGMIRDTMKCYRSVTHQARISLIKLTDREGYTPETIQKMSAKWFGEGHDQAHDAAYDVTATALLTLKAMAMQILIWEEPKSMLVQLTPEELEAEFNTPKQLDPRMFGVMTPTGPYYVNHNRLKYPELYVSDMGNEQLQQKGMWLRHEMQFDGNRSYFLDRNGMRLVISCDTNGDMVSVVTNGKIVPEEKFDLKMLLSIFNR